MIEQTSKSKVLKDMEHHFATPNKYADQFMSYLTSDEWKVISYACRRIFGFHAREDHISISQFVHGATKKDGSGYRDRGTGLCKHTVTKCIASLEEVGLMKRMANNNPRSNQGTLWGLELDYKKVDIKALEERREQKQKASRDRVQKARNSRKRAVTDARDE